MKVYRVILKPKSVIYNLPTSDTIFGAICWGIRQLYGEKELKLLLEDFDKSERKFILSSAFPIIILPKRNVYFYPKPIFPDLKVEEMEGMAENYKNEIVNKFNDNFNIRNKQQFSKKVLVSEYKKFKKVEYVSEKIFKRLISENSIDELFKEYILNNKIKLKNDTFLVTSDEYSEEKIFTSKVAVRNKIDRLTLSTRVAGELYYEREIYINSDSVKLYFFLMTEDMDFFVPIFRWLSDTGIGGNRTVGRGYYEIKIEGEISLPNTKNSNIFITLSRYLPKDKEINWEGENYYELLPYQSRFDTMFFKGGEFLKKRIIYLKEGSVLTFKQKSEYYGRLFIVAEFQNKTIYQNGIAFPIFGKIKIS